MHASGQMTSNFQFREIDAVVRIMVNMVMVKMVITVKMVIMVAMVIMVTEVTMVKMVVINAMETGQTG